MKISWLKRLINQSTGWAEFPIQYKIVESLRYGETFPKKIVKNIQNPFWKNMVQSSIKLNESKKLKKLSNTKYASMA